MATENFRPNGAVTVLTGVIVHPDGTVTPHIEVQCSGAYEHCVNTREGLLQIESVLLQGVMPIAQAMVSAPSASEAGGVQIVHAFAMPPMPMKA